MAKTGQNCISRLKTIPFAQSILKKVSRYGTIYARVYYIKFGDQRSVTFQNILKITREQAIDICKSQGAVLKEF